MVVEELAPGVDDVEEAGLVGAVTGDDKIEALFGLVDEAGGVEGKVGAFGVVGGEGALDALLERGAGGGEGGLLGGEVGGGFLFDGGILALPEWEGDAESAENLVFAVGGWGEAVT